MCGQVQRCRAVGSSQVFKLNMLCCPGHGQPCVVLLQTDMVVVETCVSSFLIRA